MDAAGPDQLRAYARRRRLRARRRRKGGQCAERFFRPGNERRWRL